MQVSFTNPGANAWIQDGDPITLIGGVGFTDYALTVSNVTFGNVGSALRDGAPAALAPCNASDSYQRWAWDTPAKGYVSNAAAAQCLNAYGCMDQVVYWSCITTGGTCCGPDCYDNLEWTLNAAGQLITSDAKGGCVTVTGDSPASLVITACEPTGGSNQTWTNHGSTGLLELSGSGLCLVAPAPPPPPPPPVPYTQVWQ